MTPADDLDAKWTLAAICILIIGLVGAVATSGCAAAPAMNLNSGFNEECMRYADAIEEKMLTCRLSQDVVFSNYDRMVRWCRATVQSPLTDPNICYTELDDASCDTVAAGYQICKVWL